MENIELVVARRIATEGQNGEFKKWAHLDLNQGPIGYEPTALTN